MVGIRRIASLEEWQQWQLNDYDQKEILFGMMQNYE